jgi:FtsZ-binding cell division protein ZapB
MDILRQVEQKIQALVSQRNQLREEMECLKAEYGRQMAEVPELRRLLKETQQQNDAVVKERDEIRRHVESILKQLEELT